MTSARFRDDLPQLQQVFVTDAGLETWLIFDRGLDLPVFASYPLLADEQGRSTLVEYYGEFVDIARRHGVGVVLETPTWRASRDWGAQLGHDDDALDAFNRDSVSLLEEVRDGARDVTVVISGQVGPRGDGYRADVRMTPDEAEAYHLVQLRTFADTAADLVSLFTVTYAEEAVGFARAGRRVDMPVVISFTVETDGRLPSGQPLGDAVRAVEDATDGSAVFYGVNCAHPEHFAGVIDAGSPWSKRLGLIRSNASRQSHAELDAATTLDDGDPDELGAATADLLRDHPQIRVIGGCCGTDHRHVEAIATACL